MRSTFGELVQQSQDYTIDDTSGSTTNLTATVDFLKRELNHANKDIFTLFKEWNIQPLPVTASTVANQIWYHNPPGLSKIESVTIPSGNINIPLRIIQSQAEWDRLHIVPLTTNFPSAIFPRRDDFGIYPTPASPVTYTLVGNYQPINMTTDDVTAGTVTVSQNSRTVTGTDTSFSADMVGRYFFITTSSGISSGSWYRIAGYTSSTELTLESYFEESTVSGGNYKIAESPNIPEELHEFLPYRAAAIYYQVRRRDEETAQRLLNFYYTGDFINSNRRGNIRGGVLGVLQDLREKGRGNSQMVQMGSPHRLNRFQYDVWGSQVVAAY